MTLVLALRGVAAIAVLTTLAGGLPRLVQLGLAVTMGLWAALIAAPALPAHDVSLVMVAAHELIIGATLGLVAAVPLLAAAAAGRLVDVTSSPRQGPYASLFSLLAAAVFVGIDGHVAVVTALVDSYRTAPAIMDGAPRVLTALGRLIPAAVTLALPWLVTAAVIEIAAGAGMRLAGRAGLHVPTAAAVPAALVMITATLVGTLAVAIAALVRAAL
ncbi:MAG: Bacterial export protein family 1 [Myxococcales bacterium]|nr:Bacterial export protein family 1 [Myxococcales bacterium]